MNKNLFAGGWVIFGALARLLPHLPNFTPTTSLCLFSGAHFNKKYSFLLLFIMMFISDLLLSLLHGHAPFGLWSLFTYSGFFGIIYMGSYLRNKVTAPRTFGALTIASIFFWIWTNLGTWLTSGLYPLTTEGFIAAYVAALPFLAYALMGDFVWATIFFFGFTWAKKRLKNKPKLVSSSCS